MIASDGLSPITPPWTSLTAYDLNDGTISLEDPAGRRAGAGGKGIKNTGLALSEGRSRGDRRRPDLHRHPRQEGPRPRRRNRQSALGEELDTALEGIPAVYEADGRQYIVFCAAAQVGLTPATQKNQRGLRGLRAAEMTETACWRARLGKILHNFQQLTEPRPRGSGRRWEISRFSPSAAEIIMRTAACERGRQRPRRALKAVPAFQHPDRPPVRMLLRDIEHHAREVREVFVRQPEAPERISKS